MSSNGTKEFEAIEGFAEYVCSNFIITISSDHRTATVECKPLGLRKKEINDIDSFPECEDCIGYDPGIADRTKIKEIYEWYMLLKKEAQEQERRKREREETDPNLARDSNPAGKAPI